MIKLIGLIIVTSIALQTQAHAEDPLCEPAAEKLAEENATLCSTKKMKAEKMWKTLAEAKTAILAAIDKRNMTALLPYVGCDSGDSSSLHTHCAQDSSKLDIQALNTIIKHSQKHFPLKNTKWITYGVKNNITLLCTSSYGFKAAKNYCDDDGKLQPVIEIMKSKSGYYLFGVPLTGVTTSI